MLKYGLNQRHLSAGMRNRLCIEHPTKFSQLQPEQLRQTRKWQVMVIRNISGTPSPLFFGTMGGVGPPQDPSGLISADYC